MTQVRLIAPTSTAAPLGGTRRIFVRDLVIPCHIGVHNHEKGRPQRVSISLDLGVLDAGASLDDTLANVVCYEKIVDGVRRLAVEGHINLVETLAEKIAELCLSDRRVELARVRVEKLDAFADAAGAGIEIERQRSA